MELIKATIKDIEILTKMNIQLRADEKIDNIMTEDEVKNRIIGFIEGNDYEIYILKDNISVYGYALINVIKNPNYLRQIYIGKEFRRKGLGKIFINEIMKKLKVNEIDVEVLVWNDKALKFYEDFGFKRRYLGLRYKENNH